MSDILACVLCPTTPYTTWAPTSSRRAAQLRFASSSKRAISSTTTVTSFPLRAASMRISISSESVPVRYTVCLMAMTFGSSAVVRMKSITGRKDWNGWCSRTSCFFSTSKRSAELKGAGRAGVNGANLSAGRSTCSCTSRSR